MHHFESEIILGCYMSCHVANSELLFIIQKPLALD